MLVMAIVKTLQSVTVLKDGAAVPLVFSLDLRSLGLARIFFGLSLLLSEYFIYAERGFSSSGYLVFGATALFTVGFFTRWATLLTWLGFYYITATVLPHPDYGMIFARAMLFFGIFIPMGSYYSIDSLITPAEGSQRIFSYPTAAWILQFFFVYFSGGITKNPDIWLWNPVALHRILSGSGFSTQIGIQLTNYPVLCALLTIATYCAEAVLPFLLFLPDRSGRIRAFVSGSFILFHIGLALTMKLDAFPFVCIALWLSIFPWSRLSLSQERGDSPHVTVVQPNIFHRFIALVILFMVAANTKTVMGDLTLYEIGTPGWFFSLLLGLSQQWVMFNTVSNG